MVQISLGILKFSADWGKTPWEMGNRLDGGLEAPKLPCVAMESPNLISRRILLQGQPGGHHCHHLQGPPGPGRAVAQQSPSPLCVTVGIETRAEKGGNRAAEKKEVEAKPQAPDSPLQREINKFIPKPSS